MDIISEIKKAIKFTEEKNFEAAEKIYLKILKEDKENPVVLSFLGLMYIKAKCIKPAEKYLEKAKKIKINKAVIEGLGFVKYYLEKYEEAARYFAEAVKTNKSFDIYDKYIKSLINSGVFTTAYEQAYECFQKYPLKKEALSNLALCCIHTGRLMESFKYSRQLITKYPKYGNGWLQYGLITEMLYHDDKQAFNCYRKALRLGEKNKAYCNLAIIATRNGDYKKAVRYLKKSVTPLTDKGELNFMLATIYFKQRKFKKAFKHYFLKELDINWRSPISRLKRPWDGKKYKEEILLVYNDQGKGDCIMFSRYFPFLEKKFKHIKIYAGEELAELFKRSFSKYKKISIHKPKKRFPHYDKSAVASNLPYQLKMDNGVFPFAAGYLIADKQKSEYYRKNYFNTDKLKVGICWEAGGIGWRELIHRTLNISLYEPFFNIAGVQYYSFQVKPCMDNYKNYPDLTDLGETFKDFDDTAAALVNLDLLVTVDTSVAHLAGALGVKTFMLLPYVTDWRWFDSTEKTDWYNSIRIFKQKNPISWDVEINNIKKCIEEMTAE